MQVCDVDVFAVCTGDILLLRRRRREPSVCPSWLDSDAGVVREPNGGKTKQRVWLNLSRLRKRVGRDSTRLVRAGRHFVRVGLTVADLKQEAMKRVSFT